VRCLGGRLGSISVPVEWTERAATASSGRLTYEGLVELAAAATGMRHP